MINLSYLPDRGVKPRQCGVTMVMDKGLYTYEAEGLAAMAASKIDFVKLGFGTSLFCENLKEKIAIYHRNNIEVYLGGTFFEACYIRGQIADYEDFITELGLHTVEISDGSINMPHDEKCRLITHFSRNFTVLSEVGSKVAGKEISTDSWIEMMKGELEAGSSFVIAEAREAGNVGIFDSKGGANVEMIEAIASQIPLCKIVWEAPQKSQQVWFVRNFGCEVNLGNIAPGEIISLETIRCGMRGDTFGLHLPEALKAMVQ